MTYFSAKNRRHIFTALAVVLFVVSFSVLVVGLILFLKKGDGCVDESKRFIEFLTKVKKHYYEHYPHETAFNPEIVIEKDILMKYQPYDPTPAAIKKTTDLAYKLSQDLNDLNLDLTQLKPRERKAVAQTRHFIESIFGNPYDENYYTGVWMMGPNYFCWQHICSIGTIMNVHFSSPLNAAEFERILDIITQHMSIIEQYQANLWSGVQAGMVRAVDDCTSGRNAFKQHFPNVVAFGAIGILSESFTQNLCSEQFYANLTVNDRSFVEKKYGTSVRQTVENALQKYVGTPLINLIDYLERNHSRYCVPSSISSGLSNLPLEHVWLDGIETKTKTTQRLPNGDKLDGKRSYDLILPYFTTSKKFHAKDIYELGVKQRDKLFVNAVRLAKQLMNITNETEAVAAFAYDLNKNKHFFNTTVIPENENGEVGSRRCKDMASAKKYCPVRYEAMQLWFEQVRQLLGVLEPLTISMFSMVGEMSTTPNCPVKMVAKFNPSSGSQSYQSAGHKCNRACEYKLPFFLKRPGPKYNAFSVAGHEARPGHHTQVQGYQEHFRSQGSKKDIFDWLEANTHYTAFVEGWALYGENPLLSQETDYYKTNPLQEYGMMKWQIWRALRLIIDTGLHDRGMTQDEALKIFKDYAWDVTDKSVKDTIRYMSAPGQATAYMIGQLSIWNIRNETDKSLGKAGKVFDEKEFHYQLLSQGSSPLDYLESYMKTYTECKISETSRKDCREILDPKLSNAKKEKEIGNERSWERLYERRRLLFEAYD